MSERQLFRVGGLWCTSCAKAVELVLSREQGVTSARVSFATGTAVVDGDNLSLDRLMRSVKKLGYRPAPWDPNPTHWVPDDRLYRSLAIRLAVAVVLGMWVMLFQLTLYVSELDFRSARLLAAGAGALCTPVVWVAGFRFHLAAFRTLRAGAPGMDFLVSAGSLSAWSLSMVHLLQGRTEVWFDSATMLITWMLLGRLWEGRIRRRGLTALQDLLRPARVRPVAGGQDAPLQPAESVSVGDLIRLEANETLGVDAEVQQGNGALDTSSLTGEARPSPTGPGDPVYAGFLLMEGSLLLRVTAAVGERRIDHMAQRVRSALDQRTQLQATAERFAERWVWLVGALALGAAVTAWAGGAGAPDAVLRGVAVLIISCPCALSLAAPVAMAAAMSTATRCGVVFRDPDGLERAARVDTVVFDKTGTLTGTAPEVVRLETAADRDQVLSWAASAEWGLNHPYAVALRRAAHSRGLPLECGGVRESVPGRGVQWTAPDGARIRVGAPGSFVSSTSQRLAAPPSDAVGIEKNGQAVGWLQFEVPLRPEAQEAATALRSAGITLQLGSGDADPRVESVARTLGIDSYRGRQSPEAKADHVASLPRAAFVGDGINDAPALARAHLGIAVPHAADAALAAASVVLQGGGLMQLVRMLALARKTMSVIRQNLVWAVGYNVVALPAAFFGFVSPEWAALAMLSSSLTVSLNALRLRRMPSASAAGDSPKRRRRGHHPCPPTLKPAQTLPLFNRR